MLGSEDYRYGALSRLKDAQTLRDQRRWVGSIYLAGRAVEALLRSLLWANTREQEIGHDLRQLLTRARSLGMVKAEDESHIQDALGELAVIWHNDMRFAGEGWVKKRLRTLGRHKRIGDMRVERDPLKANALKVLEACETIMSRGELLWTRFEQRLKELIEKHLEAGQAELETLPDSHVCGHVIPPEFRGKSYEQRRNRLKEITEQELDREDLLKISTLLTYTPEEWSFEPA